MDILNFSRSRGEIVYVFYAVKDDVRIPFYVGESGRGLARIADYMNAQFAAPTDFKVGTTAKLLEKAGFEVIVEIENDPDRKRSEKQKIEELRKKWSLLNFEKGYDYRKDNSDQVTARLQKFVDDNFRSLQG